MIYTLYFLDTFCPSPWQMDLMQNQYPSGRVYIFGMGIAIRNMLFDLWVANEDRNHNNYNLLLNPTESGYCLMPIDHERCFNGSRTNIDRPLVLLTEDQSLVASPLVQLLFRGIQDLKEKLKKSLQVVTFGFPNAKMALRMP